MKKLDSQVFRTSTVPGELDMVLNFLGSPAQEFGHYARPFHETARTLARNLLRRRRSRALDALPIIYLYRHALELYMKAIILEGNRIMAVHGKVRSDEEIWRVMDGHRLTRLLPEVQKVFKFVRWKWSGHDPDINTFSKIRQVFLDVEKVDPESFAFRYPTNKRGHGSVPRHFAVSLRGFVSVIDPIVESLDTALFGLSHEYDRANDAMSG